MVTKEDMAKAYVEQVKAKIVELNAQVKALEQHLTECESQIDYTEEEKEGASL